VGADGSAFDPAIVEYYDRTPEESRLEQGAFRLEQERTRELLDRFMPPPPAAVVDVGGAAGAYALWLAERGYGHKGLKVSAEDMALMPLAKRQRQAQARGR